MVDKVTNFNFPESEHIRWAHAQKDLEASPLQAHDASIIARSTQLAQTTISPSFFDQLFRPKAKGPVHDEEPAGYTSQALLRNDLFGSVANLDSLIDVIMNYVNKEKEKEGGKGQKKKKEEGEEEEEGSEDKREKEVEKETADIIESAGNVIVDLIKARKEEDMNREFVRNKIGSLRQG